MKALGLSHYFKTQGKMAEWNDREIEVIKNIIN